MVFSHSLIVDCFKKRHTEPSYSRQTSRGFTIVELLVVIVVIGILAAITIVSYTGITKKATEATLTSDLNNGSKQLKLYQAEHGSYPTGINTATGCPTGPVEDTKYCLKASSGNTFDIANYTSGGATFRLTETNADGTRYGVTDSTGPTASSPYIQTITATSCPSTRTQVQDARDSHTYWVQKLADGKCWMLTNLGYAGGGTNNTYSDIKTLTNGSTSGSNTYTVASYYVTPSTTNFTTEPTAPSTSTTGTGQYGYLYNFCGANGGQTGNGACSSTDSTAVNTTISICPSGWRLPTSGEFTALNTTINGGSTTTDTGLIGAPWLAQRGGYWGSGFGYQGSGGFYWSSTQYSATDAYSMYFSSTVTYPAGNNGRSNGFAVRCLAV